MVKIAYFYPHFAHVAGTERILINKMNYLAEQMGYEVVMLTYEQGNHPLPFPLSPKVRREDLGVNYYRLFRYTKVLRFWKWRKLDRLLQARYNAFMEVFRPDIVICVTSHAIIAKLMIQCKVPYVRIMESHIDRRFNPGNAPINSCSFLRWIHLRYNLCFITKLAREFDMLVALNQSDADDWGHYVKSTVITDIVSLNETGKYSNLQNKRVIFVGRYAEQKGIPDLLKIWSVVHQKHPDWHLYLYGEGDLRPMIEAEANRLKVNIHVESSTNQIFERYMESSILVLTSLYEPFGLVMPEAMSCGLPVVAFDCPSGPANIITDEVDGFLVPNRDIKGFADRLCQLIESPSLRQRMGQAAILSSQRFSAENIMGQWDALFRSLSQKEE